MTTEQPTPDLPVEAVEAAAKAINAVETPNGVWELEDLEDILFRRDQARAALAAAWPLLRAQIADDLRAFRDSEGARLGGHRSALTLSEMRAEEMFIAGIAASAARADVKINAEGAGRG